MRAIEVSSDSESESQEIRPKDPSPSLSGRPPVLLGSQAGKLRRVDDGVSDESDWDVVAPLEWAQKVLGDAWDSNGFEAAKNDGKAFFFTKVGWRGIVLDLIVPISERSFAATLLRVPWYEKENLVEIATTGEKAILPSISFLYRIKESHCRCQRSLDWSKHMHKLSKLAVAQKKKAKAHYDPRIYPMLDALREQHFALYGSNGNRIESGIRPLGRISPSEIAKRATDFGELSLQEFLCRSEDLIWNEAVLHFKQVEEEYQKLRGSSNTVITSGAGVVVVHHVDRLWPSIPSDVHGLIFRRMNAADFMRMQMVCRMWKSYFENAKVLRFLYQVLFEESLQENVKVSLFMLSAREICNRPLSLFTKQATPDESVLQCLEMRDKLFVAHALPAPSPLKKDVLEWLNFVANNVYIVAPMNKTQGVLKGRELHETPRSIDVQAWFPGYSCSVTFHAGTEGSSQTSWEAIRLVVLLKDTRGKECLRLDTNGIDLFDGYMTRYGDAYFSKSDYNGAKKEFSKRLTSKCGKRFDLALLLSFLCTCLVIDSNIITRVKRYLTDLPGLNKASLDKEKARRKKYNLSEPEPEPEEEEEEEEGKKCFIQ